MSLPTLQTSRLILRAFEMTDAPVVQRLAGDRAIADTTSNIPHPYKDGMAEAWISTHAEAYARRESIRYAVVTQADDQLIGSISLMNIDMDARKAELGYWIGKPF